MKTFAQKLNNFYFYLATASFVGVFAYFFYFLFTKTSFRTTPFNYLFELLIATLLFIAVIIYLFLHKGLSKEEFLSKSNVTFLIFTTVGWLLLSMVVYFTVQTKISQSQGHSAEGFGWAIVTFLFLSGSAFFVALLFGIFAWGKDKVSKSTLFFTIGGLIAVPVLLYLSRVFIALSHNDQVQKPVMIVSSEM